MELTREKVKDWLSKTKNDYLFASYIVSDLCTALLAEMDKPKMPVIDWDSRLWATEVRMGYCSKDMSGDRIGDRILTIQRPKSRIDEIAEEAVDKYRRGAVGAGSLTDIIKSAILKDREEREAGR